MVAMATPCTIFLRKIDSFFCKYVELKSARSWALIDWRFRLYKGFCAWGEEAKSPPPPPPPEWIGLGKVWPLKTEVFLQRPFYQNCQIEHILLTSGATSSKRRRASSSRRSVWRPAERVAETTAVLMTLKSCPRSRPLDDGRSRLSEDPVELWKSLDVLKTWKTTATVFSQLSKVLSAAKEFSATVMFPSGNPTVWSAAKFSGNVIAAPISLFWISFSTSTAVPVMFTIRISKTGIESTDFPGKPVSLLIQVSWAATAKFSPGKVNGSVEFCKAELSKSFFSNWSILSKSLKTRKNGR